MLRIVLTSKDGLGSSKQLWKSWGWNYKQYLCHNLKDPLSLPVMPCELFIFLAVNTNNSQQSANYNHFIMTKYNLINSINVKISTGALLNCHLYLAISRNFDCVASSNLVHHSWLWNIQQIHCWCFCQTLYGLSSPSTSCKLNLVAKLSLNPPSFYADLEPSAASIHRNVPVATKIGFHHTTKRKFS